MISSEWWMIGTLTANQSPACFNELKHPNNDITARIWWSLRHWSVVFPICPAEIGWLSSWDANVWTWKRVVWQVCSVSSSESWTHEILTVAGENASPQERARFMKMNNSPLFFLLLPSNALRTEYLEIFSLFTLTCVSYALCVQQTLCCLLEIKRLIKSSLCFYSSMWLLDGWLWCNSFMVMSFPRLTSSVKVLFLSVVSGDRGEMIRCVWSSRHTSDLQLTHTDALFHEDCIIFMILWCLGVSEAVTRMTASAFSSSSSNLYFLANTGSKAEFLSKTSLYVFLNCSFIAFQLVILHENSRGSWHGIKTPTNHYCFSSSSSFSSSFFSAV